MRILRAVGSADALSTIFETAILRTRNSQLALDRLEIVHEVQAYADALVDPTKKGRSLDVPRILFGPFKGREADIPPIDAATRRDLNEIEDALSFTFPTDHKAWEASLQDSELFSRFHPLPAIPRRPWETLGQLSETDYIERVYGSRGQYERARRKHFQAIDPFRKRSMFSLGPMARPSRSDKIALYSLLAFGIVSFAVAAILRYLHYGP
jgi:hypothetical protein